MNLPQAIREARVKHGLSQRTLAQKIGVTGGAVWKYETGKSSPSLAHLQALADALDLVFVVDGDGPYLLLAMPVPERKLSRV